MPKRGLDACPQIILNKKPTYTVPGDPERSTWCGLRDTCSTVLRPLLETAPFLGHCSTTDTSPFVYLFPTEHLSVFCFLTPESWDRTLFGHGTPNFGLPQRCGWHHNDRCEMPSRTSCSNFDKFPVHSICPRDEDLYRQFTTPFYLGILWVNHMTQCWLLTAFLMIFATLGGHPSFLAGRPSLPMFQMPPYLILCPFSAPTTTISTRNSIFRMCLWRLPCSFGLQT